MSDLGIPKTVERAVFQTELDALRVREKAHIREGDAIAAARRRLPMVELDAAATLIGPRGPITLFDAFEDRRQLIAYCQGPYDESFRYRDFMGWDMPRYSAQDSLDTLLVGRHIGLMHLVSYLRHDDQVFETYWTTRRGVEAMDYRLALMDLTAYGRQEPWEDSPPGWPQSFHVDGSNTRTNGRPTAQWSRVEAGRSDKMS